MSYPTPILIKGISLSKLLVGRVISFLSIYYIGLVNTFRFSSFVSLVKSFKISLHFSDIIVLFIICYNMKGIEFDKYKRSLPAGCLFICYTGISIIP